MNIEQFFEEIDEIYSEWHGGELYIGSERTERIKEVLNKVSELSIYEIIKYIENDAEIAIPLNELMHEDGRHLTKKEYGDVLLKYLILELKERFN